MDWSEGLLDAALAGADERENAARARDPGAARKSIHVAAARARAAPGVLGGAHLELQELRG